MKILLATDGSEYSTAAIDFCRNLLVNAENTSFKIISAVEYPAPMAAEPFAVSAEYYNAIEEGGRKQARVFTEQAEKQLRAIFPEIVLDVSRDVIGGSPRRVIVEIAKEWGADLIVMGSHGYGFWSRTLLGSVSNAAMHQAPCSVLIVRKNE
jgi:nucleotide-binding universal stress UspA family protein